MKEEENFKKIYQYFVNIIISSSIFYLIVLLLVALIIINFFFVVCPPPSSSIREGKIIYIIKLLISKLVDLVQ